MPHFLGKEIELPRSLRGSGRTSWDAPQGPAPPAAGNVPRAARSRAGSAPPFPSLKTTILRTLKWVLLSGFPAVLDPATRPQRCFPAASAREGARGPYASKVTHIRGKGGRNLTCFERAQKSARCTEPRPAFPMQTQGNGTRTSDAQSAVGTAVAKPASLRPVPALPNSPAAERAFSPAGAPGCLKEG